jgi:hypothetical protein
LFICELSFKTADLLITSLEAELHDDLEAVFMIFFLLNSWITIRIWQSSLSGRITATCLNSSRYKQRYVIAPVINKPTGEETECMA